MRVVLLCGLSLWLFCGAVLAMPLEGFLRRPKLVVVIVVDQLRADYLTRFHDRFVRPGKDKQTGGFLFLMKEGAYFPFAEYDVFQNMTCSGHAMIMTGTTPDRMGIPSNEWFDHKTKKMVECTEDNFLGHSPKNLKTSTVGDELKNSGVAAKIIGISLKERSAIMLAGHRADLALWFDHKNGQWLTSAFYQPSLPGWTVDLNQELLREKKSSYLWKTKSFEKKYELPSKAALASPYGTELLFKAASQALTTEKLGLNKGTDLLLLSLSNHDFVGHEHGPNSPEIEELLFYEDEQISKFLTHVKRHMKGFKDVVVVLTADHGVAPLVEDMKSVKIDAGKIDAKELSAELDEKLNQNFGAPKAKKWIAATKYLHFWLDQDVLKEKKISSEKVEEFLRPHLQRVPGVLTVFTRGDALKNQWPTGVLGEQIKKQYLLNQSGDLILIPRPFYFEKDKNNTTHITGYSYDRQVPMIMMADKIRAGVYTSPAKVLDLAPTLSFILGVTAPATNQGQVLQIFK